MSSATVRSAEHLVKLPARLSPFKTCGTESPAGRGTMSPGRRRRRCRQADAEDATIEATGMTPSKTEPPCSGGAHAHHGRWAIEGDDRSPHRPSLQPLSCKGWKQVSGDGAMKAQRRAMLAKKYTCNFSPSFSPLPYVYPSPLKTCGTGSPAGRGTMPSVESVRTILFQEFYRPIAR